MTAATLMPKSVDVAETVRAMEAELEAAQAEVARLRRALVRIAQTAVDLRSDIPETPEVPFDMADGACRFLGGMAQAALR